MVGWIKNKTQLYVIYKRLNLNFKDTVRLKVKGRKRVFHASRKQKKAVVVVFISDKIDVNSKSVLR